MKSAQPPQASEPSDLLICSVLQRKNFALDVNVRLPGRGVTTIFGPSGCGKTTLLRCIAGLERPRSGRIIIAGQSWQDDARGFFLPTHKRSLGMVFQDAALFEHLSVQANLDFGRKRSSRHQERISLSQAIDLLGIGHLLQRRPRQLSGGERQRVAIARALATSPRLLLMDEPLASLDLPRKAELLPWFERLARELHIPILYVTHALDEVARLADHLLLMANGRARAQGESGKLLADLDFARQHGDQAGALVQGRIRHVSASDGLMTLDFDGGQIHCVPAARQCNYPTGTNLRLRILARDVSLARSAATDSSILNILPVTVTGWTDDGPAQQLLALQAGASRLLARITRRSARLLQVHEGQQLYAQIKSVAILD